ncbi:MAG: hypothetical protein B6U69_04190 [Thermofilum sp. ex4484_15]|nr:MAG: hypothetical protein B6U69_04190 [Thermofilum sp. ex4484_15]
MDYRSDIVTGNKLMVSLMVSLFILSSIYASPTNLRELVNSINDFSLRLYLKVRKEGENAILSPFNVFTALTLIYEGARGGTANKVRSILNLPVNTGRLRSSFHNLLSKEVINEWIREETGRRIKELIPPGGIDRQTRLVITSVIYFRGIWLYRFNKSETKEGYFWVKPNKTIKIPFMHLRAKLPYFESNYVKVLELPFSDNKTCMVIFLPKEGLRSFENSLSIDKLHELLHKLKEVEVEVYIPKFKLSSGYSLAKILSEMGLRKLFTSEADLSGISGKKDLYVKEIFHKAYTEVSEEGVEATAATAAVIALLALPVTFRADKPFLFLILHKPTGLILFLGRLVNPKADNSG